LALRDGDVPQTISTSYSDDEQSGKDKHPIHFLGLTITMWTRVFKLSHHRLVVHHDPELTCAFLVPQDYAVRVCKEFGLLGESYFIIQ